MALASMISVNPVIQPNANVVTNGKGVIVQAVTDAIATAASAGELLAPLSFAGSNCRWIKLGTNTGRLMLRARYDLINDMTTAPIVRIFGVYSPNSDPNPSFANDGTIEVVRLDGLNAATGITISRIVATDLRDTTYRYTDWQKFTHPQTGLISDCAGASHVIVLCSTAAVGAASSAVAIEALILN
jgi:hypothetical protein